MRRVIITTKHLGPFNWLKKNGQGKPMAIRGEEHPLAHLQREIDNIFENFFSGWQLTPQEFKKTPLFEHMLLPKVDICEDERNFCIMAELPGIEQEDIDISLSNGILTLCGEKKAEKEEKGKHFHRIERSFGSINRAITLPSNVDENKIDATFKNGVLTIDIAKKGKGPAKAKKIAVKKEK